MERTFPTLLWAEAAAGSGYLAVVNPDDGPVARAIALDHPGLPPWVARVTEAREVWSGRIAPVRGARLEVGPLAPHAARLYRVGASVDASS